MPRPTLRKLPGQVDINNQYSAAHIQRSLDVYRQIADPQGDYRFGELTAKFYQLDENETRIWLGDVARYPRDVRDEIKRLIIHALNHKDDSGRDSPIPITFKWTVSTSSKALIITYKPSGPPKPPGPSYKVEIVGYPSPLRSALAERRAKARKK
jgi:hypothetical protein